MNDLSLHIMDIMQNSIAAGATLVGVGVEEDIGADMLLITIRDNGKGMMAEQVARLDDPFFTTRTTRRVGMGIPLFRHSAEQSGGSLNIESAVGVGTVVKAVFIRSHIDCPPLGDLANSFIFTVSMNPQVEFVLEYIYNGNQYRFDTVEVKEVIDGLPLNDPGVMKTLSGMINVNIEDMQRA